MSHRIKAEIALFFVSIVWGTAFVAQRLAAIQDSVFVFNALRFLLAAAILIPFVRRSGRITLREYLIIGLTGSILFIASAFQQFGLRYTTAGNAGFITSLYVVLVPIVMWLGWREHPGWKAWVAVIFAALGGFLLSTGGNFIIQIGDGLEFVGAVFWALHVVAIGKFSIHLDPIKFASGQFFVCGLLSLFVGLIMENPSIGTIQPIIGGVIYTGIFSVGLGYTVQVLAQRYTPPTHAALILSLEAVMALVFGWLLLGETLTLLQLTGCIAIFLAIILVQIPDNALKRISQ